MNKFKLKVIGSVCLLVLAVVVVLTSINYITFKEESLTLHKALIQKDNNNIGANIEQQVNNIRNIIESVHISSEDITKDGELSDNAKLQLTILRDSQKDIAKNVFLFSKEGLMWNADSSLKTINVRTLNRDYYNGIFRKNNDFYVSDLYMSTTSGNYAIGIAVRLSENTAILSSVDVKDLLGRNFDKGRIFIYDRNGLIIQAPYNNFIGKSIFDKRPAYRSFDSNTKEIKYTTVINNKKAVLHGFWNHIKALNWNTVTFEYQSVINTSAKSNLITALIVSTTALCLTFLTLLYLISNFIIKPIGGSPDNIEAKMEAMSTGNLSEHLDNENAMGVYASLIAFKEKLVQLVTKSNNVANSVASAAQELNVVLSDTQVNTQSETQQIEEIATAINELSATSQEVSVKAVQAEEETRLTAESVSLGSISVEETLVITDKVSLSIKDTANIINELVDYSKEIGEVTKVINDISDQTNLLALNAAIEAARAGDYGRGFAVVSDEVRTLASKTQEATISIQDTIEKLQTQAELAHSNVEDNVELISESVEKVDSVKHVFTEVEQSVAKIADINTLVATASQEQFCVTEDISKNITLALDIVRQNASAVDQALVASDELAKLAEEQRVELEFFKV